MREWEQFKIALSSVFCALYIIQYSLKLFKSRYVNYILPQFCGDICGGAIQLYLMLPSFAQCLFLQRGMAVNVLSWTWYLAGETFTSTLISHRPERSEQPNSNLCEIKADMGIGWHCSFSAIVVRNDTTQARWLSWAPNLSVFSGFDWANFSPPRWFNARYMHGAIFRNMNGHQWWINVVWHAHACLQLLALSQYVTVAILGLWRKLWEHSLLRHRTGRDCKWHENLTPVTVKLNYSK